MALLSEPLFFFSILGVLFLVSIAVIVVWGHKEKKLIRDKEGLIEKINQSFTEVVNKADERERDLKKKLTELEKENGESGALQETITRLERELAAVRGDNTRLQNQLRQEQKDTPAPDGSQINEQLRQENVSLNSRITALQQQLEQARKGILPAGADSLSDAQVKELRGQLAKVNQELYLKDKLYEGLKAQYSELEKSSERVMQQLEDEKKSQRLISQKLWDITKPK